MSHRTSLISIFLILWIVGSSNGVRLRDVFVTFGHRTTATVIRDLDQRIFSTRADKVGTVMMNLKSKARESQGAVLKFLDMKKGQRAPLEVTSFWISNQLFVKGATEELIQELRAFEGVTKVQDEPNYFLDAPTDVHQSPRPHENELQWGIVKVDAPGAWSTENGNNGSGIVVGTMDTGARLSHESLRDNFVGDFGWFDPYKGQLSPIDEAGHGTHTLGTIVGSHGIGVAPGAKWMTCRACYKGFCTPEAMLACGQFLLCPTDPQGNNPDCSKAPHVASNSFGGGQGRDLLWPVFDAWAGAGIIIVFSNGNMGPFCGTANSHADAPQVIGVGGTDNLDNLYVRSSVGPTVYSTMKPDIAGPGVDVVSAYHTGDDIYYKMTGTSMAAPHVAGAIAILLADTPGLSLEEVKNILGQAAETKLGLTGRNCGGIREDVFPNHTYGRGRVNVLRALKRLHDRNNEVKTIKIHTN